MATSRTGRWETLRAGLAAIAVLASGSCGSTRAPETAPQPSFESSFVGTLAEACPIAKEDDAPARDACAERLGGLTALQTRMAEPFLWGAQDASTDGLDDVHTTRLNPLAWLKMYLSLEMFTGDFRVDRVGPRTIVHASTRFRNRLDAGEYPYPFWHTTAGTFGGTTAGGWGASPKWDSYQFARETVFFFERGTLVGALRSAAQDRTRPASARSFDGDWGISSGAPSPRVVLYQRLFSQTNPHAAEVDRAFRAFEEESRQYHCASCHRPDNPAGQKQLAMLCYPNQALSSRHTIVRAIAERRMPPALAHGETSGIDDDTKRERLLELARAFASAADAALAAETARDQGRTVAVPSK